MLCHKLFFYFSTLSTSQLVPHRDQPCTQWVSFNGDNEPVLNNAPEVDDGCDTFLKRLQRAKLSDQSGKGNTYTAYVPMLHDISAGEKTISEQQQRSDYITSNFAVSYKQIQKMICCWRRSRCLVFDLISLFTTGSIH